jgi:quercetin dioxygenase-like cupin family protein
MRPETPPDFQQSDLFGGNGTVELWNLKQKAMPPFTTALWCSLEPNGSVGRHKQQEDSEVILCISGDGLAKVGQTIHRLTTGALIYLPFGQVLSLKNSSSTDSLNYVIIKAKN